MYMARINDVMEQNNMYSVSFLKKHTDRSYYWPDKECICDVDDMDVLKMSIPSEDIHTFRQSCNSASQVIVRFGRDKRCSQTTGCAVVSRLCAGLPSERSEIQTPTRAEIWIEIFAPCTPQGAVE